MQDKNKIQLNLFGIIFKYISDLPVVRQSGNFILAAEFPHRFHIFPEAVAPDINDPERTEYGTPDKIVIICIQDTKVIIKRTGKLSKVTGR